MILLEATNVCNLSCVMCPIDRMERKKGYMSYELFTSIIDQLCEMPLYTRKKRIVLHGTGEPLLSKDFLRNLHYPGFVELALDSNYGIRDVDVTSNGVIMTEEQAHSLLSAEALKWVRISFNSSRREVYSRLQRKGDYDSVIATLRMLKSIAGNYNVGINVQYLKTHLNLDETQQEFERVLGFQFDDQIYWTIKDCVSYGRQIPTNRIEQTVIHELIDQKPQNCYSRGLIVMWDGTVVGCCIDYDNAQPYGHLAFQTVREVVNSNYHKQLKKEYNEHDYKRLPLCRDCHGINV